ncbi:4-oxalocrotonate tautomerase family protein [Streptomyces sp. NPDC018693]|uniref:tautomerase family protein n=1 Tax=unclassified Streptomyces TaxID=2593676 RepID=UPI0037B78D3D
MPITVIAPRDVLTPEGERDILPRLTETLLEATGLTGNTFFAPLVGATLHLVEPGQIHAGGVPKAVVIVELKLPNIGLPSVESRAAFIAAATDVVDALTIAGHDRADIWINIVNAPDGGWGIGGRAYTGDDLVTAITEAASAG